MATRSRRRRRISDSTPTVQARAWLEWHGESLLGQGRLALLEAIDTHGSISAAARAMGVSYRAAWRWIDEMNGAAGESLVETTTGGAGGGGARLTVLGRALLEATRRLHARLADFTAEVEAELACDFAGVQGARAQRRRPAGGR